MFLKIIKTLAEVENNLLKKKEKIVNYMSEKLDKEQRAKLSDGAFVFPEQRKWPIHDVEHAMTAINFMKAGFGKKRDYKTVKDAIKQRYKDNKKVMNALSEV